MIVEAANHDKLNGIVVVGGTKEAMGNVSIDELKERTQLLITKAKSVAEAVTVGSVLPWRDHDPERLGKVNGAIRETCREMCVKYVDHDGNFTFRDGTVDEAAYASDGLHLSRGGSRAHAGTHAVSHRGRPRAGTKTTTLGTGARTYLKRTHDTSHAMIHRGRPRARTQTTSRYESHVNVFAIH